MKRLILLFILTYVFTCVSAKDLFIDRLEQPTAQEKGTQNSRKGLHLGFNLAPGFGAFLTDNTNFGFAINSGLDLNIYFNNILGIKTGLSVMYFSSKSKFELSTDYGATLGFNGTKGGTTSLGIPLKFLITTGNTIGFYFESGLAIYFPVYSNLSFNQTIMGMDRSSFFEPQTIVYTLETTIGFNVHISNMTSLNAGLLINYSFNDYYQNSYNIGGFDTNGLIIGFNFGMVFKLTN